MSGVLIERIMICAGEETNEAKREVWIAAAKRIAELEEMREMVSRAFMRAHESVHKSVPEKRT